MKIFNTASLAVFSVALFLSGAAYSQNKELNELKGYSPPPMFSGTSPSPAPAPVAAPEPAQTKQAPPSIEAVQPPPVAAPKVEPPPVAQPAPQKNAYSAEDILSFPANPNSIPAAPAPEKLPLPTAVPAAEVEKALPLPGSVAPLPKKKETTPAKAPPKKAEKKTEKKEAPKKPAVKEVKKPAKEKKPESKPVAKPKPKTEPTKKEIVQPKSPVKQASASVKVPEKAKPAPDPVKKPAEPVIPEKPVQKKAEKPPLPPVSQADLPAPLPPTVSAIPELPVPDKKVKPYRLDGKKNMPVIKPTGVEKTPLPDIPVAPPANLPTPNEQIIDKALQDRLMKPDVKSIIKSDAPAMNAKTLSEKPARKNPVVTAATPPVKKNEKLTASMLSIEYKPGVTDVQKDHKEIIEAEILPKLRQDKNSRLQILAYASASEEGQSSARRLSLARSMELRAYILEQDIRPSRIDIRALGDKTQEKPVDRVDLRFIPSN